MKNKDTVFLALLVVFCLATISWISVSAGLYIERLNATKTQIEQVEHWKTRYNICRIQFFGDIAEVKKQMWEKVKP